MEAEQLPLRPILLSVIFSTSVFIVGIPAWANSAAPVIFIENQAVGSFLEPVDSASPQQVESNVVNDVDLETPGTTNRSMNMTSSEPNIIIDNQAQHISETVQ